MKAASVSKILDRASLNLARLRRAAGLACIWCGNLACTEFSIPDGDGARPSVRLDPEAELDAAPSVLRLIISNPAPETIFGVHLYEGQLSGTQIKRVLVSDPPQSLVEKEQSAASWLADGKLVVAPLGVLRGGTRYSLVSESHGLLTHIDTSVATKPVLERFFPPRDIALEQRLGRQIFTEQTPAEAPTVSGFGVYCADERLASESSQGRMGPVALPVGSSLEPAQLEASLTAGIGTTKLRKQQCVELFGSGSAAANFALPPLLDSMALQPYPIDLAEIGANVAANCNGDTIALGPGCLEVLDDRMILTPKLSGSLWLIAAGSLEFIRVAREEQPLVLKGFAASSSYDITAEVIDSFGQRKQWGQHVVTQQLREHVVINEVYADAIGAEPEQEWVELYNDGGELASLGGYQLEDAGGMSSLPAITLGPQQFGLIVGSGFSPEVDLPPAANSIMIRVAQVGVGGLSNQGEPLRLVNASGEVVSRFPATPKPKRGVSVARRTPETLDDDAAGFGLSAEPGASPGAPNSLSH